MAAIVDVQQRFSAGWESFFRTTRRLRARAGRFPGELTLPQYHLLEASVIGVPDERYGEELMAWIRVREGQTLTEDEVREYCKDRIAHFKRPRYVKFADEFPMTVTGKVQKYKMREQAIEELGLEVQAPA